MAVYMDQPIKGHAEILSGLDKFEPVHRMAGCEFVGDSFVTAGKVLRGRGCGNEFVRCRLEQKQLGLTGIRADDRL